MPLYEYECESGEHRFERIQKFSDPPIETCPSCGRKVRKLLSSPAIQFKGSGWYITDYARKKASGDGKGSGSKPDSKTTESSSGESSSTSDSSTTSSTKSESKPDTKPSQA
jgi:putative FmdB family regulatory protein